MDEKKVREAIAKEKETIKALEDAIVGGKTESLRRWAKDTIENSTIIIEVLEKQLPKEIKAINPERSEESGDVEFCCPNCNSHYLYDITDVPNYCPECGIRFDT